MPGTPIKIGYSLSLTGPLAANGQTAHLAHQIWQEDINARGGLLGREINLVCIDDRTDAGAKLVGGAMIGPQSSTVQAELGPLLNGIVNYEYWLPVPAMDFPGVGKLIATYQSRAKDTAADALGYYVAPFAYAQLQVVEQAIRETGGLDDAELAEYIRAAEFPTIVGDVTFGRLGAWAAPRVLTVQFRDIHTTGIAEFAKPDARVVVSPVGYASGDLVYPYRAAEDASAR